MLLAPLIVLVSACSGGGSQGASTDDVLVVVSAPMSTEPWIGTFIERGARLAVDELNAHGGVTTPSGARRVKLAVLDNAGSPAKAAANARKAVDDHAAVLLTDGTGAASVASVTDPAHLPVFICFEGGEALIDPSRWPSLFRMAPANKPMARRLADYIANSRPKVGVISDDSTYGEQGRDALLQAFKIDEVEVVADQKAPTRSSDLTTQVLAARQAGADKLVVWASASDVIAAIQAVHALGWKVPIYTGPTGEDPLVRQRFAEHPDWLDQVTFASFRMTSEVGPRPFEEFRANYEAKMGVDLVGVHQDGKQVVQPPDWPMFSYDAVRLIAASLSEGGELGQPLMEALNKVSITGANGDYRGYAANQHEGVNPSDMYFARFHGFVFEPVDDDPLSDTLPSVNQLQD
ncbi:ABC transporter substrate-binding protein [Streptosporangium sp. NPDC087985]|uniref:ABC transporter substrate-binding protein n=1 Tax=Streptosporangium sp. NPDC087985 TaxID=3366196 RepID=UPI0037FD2B05